MSDGTIQAFQLRPADTRLQGRILREVLVEAMSTSQISKRLHEPLAVVRTQLIRMHHLHLVEAIAIRREDDAPPAIGYYQDYVWTITVHAREHKHIEKGCLGCWIRTLYLAGADAIYE